MTAETREIELHRSLGQILAKQSSINEHMERVEERMEHLDARVRGIEKPLREIQQTQRVQRWAWTVMTGVLGSVMTAALIKHLHF